MKERVCEHCGHELHEFDDDCSDWHCPNDCNFEIANAEDKAQNDSGDDVVIAIEIGDQNALTTDCWFCSRPLVRLEKLKDPPYGHICNDCGHSLRNHPSLGKGQQNDLALRGQDAVAEATNNRIKASTPVISPVKGKPAKRKTAKISRKKSVKPIRV